MAGNRGSGFWDSFFDDDDERSDSYVVFGSVPQDFQDFYYNLVMESPNYEDMTPREKLILADDFVDLFIRGGFGYTAGDQEAWIYLLGLRPSDFDWDEYASIYDHIYG